MDQIHQDEARQLSLYAEDFQELLRRISKLEHRNSELRKINKKLSENKLFPSSLEGISEDICIVITNAGHVEYANTVACEKFVFNEKTDTHFRNIISPNYHSQIASMLKGIDITDGTKSNHQDFLVSLNVKSKKAKLYKAYCMLVSCEQEKFAYCVLQNYERENKNDSNHQDYSLIRKNSNQGVLILDASCKIIHCDTNFTAYTGYLVNEIRGRSVDDIHLSLENESFNTSITDSIGEHGHWIGTASLKTKSKSTHKTWLSTTILYNNTGGLYGHVLMFTNVDKILSAKTALFNLACHDPLTGFAGPHLFEEMADHLLIRDQKDLPCMTLVFMEIIGLDWINKIEGNEYEETILLKISRRLKEKIRGCDLIGRIESNKFAILLAGNMNQTDATWMVNRLVKSILNPFIANGEKLATTTNVGCAIYPKDGRSIKSLMINAKVAMNLARTETKYRYRFRSAPDPTETVRIDFNTYTGHDALWPSRDIYLAYTAHIDVYGKNEILAFEPQIRMQHPLQGDVACKQHDAIEINIQAIIWMLKRASIQINAWRGVNALHIPMICTVKIDVLRADEFVEQLLILLSDSMLDPGLLEIQIEDNSAFFYPGIGNSYIKMLIKIGVSVKFCKRISELRSTLVAKNSFIHATSSRRQGQFYEQKSEDHLDIDVFETKDIYLGGTNETQITNTYIKSQPMLATELFQRAHLHI
jgi:diguanylate cyclase (GGDEF)-like protein